MGRFADCFGDYGYMEGNMIRTGFGNGMIIYGVICTVLAVVLIVLLFKTLNKKNNNNIVALEILNKKFANGEISNEEYINKKEALSK